MIATSKDTSRIFDDVENGEIIFNEEKDGGQKRCLWYAKKPLSPEQLPLIKDELTLLKDVLEMIQVIYMPEHQAETAYNKLNSWDLHYIYL